MQTTKQPFSLIQRPRAVSAAAVLSLMAAACSSSPGFDIRTNQDAPLNAPTSAVDSAQSPVSVRADKPFRVRLEVEVEGATQAQSFDLQMRRNSGAWETLTAHDFPFPQRELSIDFTSISPDVSAIPWTLLKGDTSAFWFVTDDGDQVLRVSPTESNVDLVIPTEWPIPEYGFVAQFKFNNSTTNQFDVLLNFENDQNHDRFRVSADGMLDFIRVRNGTEESISTLKLPPLAGEWHELEIELSDSSLDFYMDEDELSLSATVEPSSTPRLVGLTVESSAAVDFAEIAVDGVPLTPRVSIVSSGAYERGEQTTDVIAGSTAAFNPGLGVSLQERTPPINGNDYHTEFEWPLVIRRLSDGPTENDDGDLFEFRMVDPNNSGSVRSAVASVTLNVPDYHMGGTYIETPGRIGPWQAKNGDLYFIMEPSETDNKFMMMKSTDGGRTWVESDAQNRPMTGDLESVDGRQIGDQIHIIHQISESLHYHVFATSDHANSPDAWLSTDEVAAEAEAFSQTSTLVVREDGVLAAIFLADKLNYTMRGLDGAWSDPIELDPEDDLLSAGPQAVLGANNDIHFAYFSENGAIWYRQLLADGTLTERQLVASNAGTTEDDLGAVLPFSYDADAGEASIAYRLEDGSLWETRVTDDAVLSAPQLITRGPVIANATDSQQPAADFVRVGDKAFALYVDEASRAIYSTRREGGEWQEPVLEVDNIEGSWVRGEIITMPDGQKAYGYVYDAGSLGGTGLNRFGYVTLKED
ncbi:MAG: hypothetical protein NXH88_11600 [Hyphomonas sp.]|nr:hypothetical protein [Hyphomonas sp.]